MEYNTLCNRVYGDNAGAGKEGAWTKNSAPPLLSLKQKIQDSIMCLVNIKMLGLNKCL